MNFIVNTPDDYITSFIIGCMFGTVAVSIGLLIQTCIEIHIQKKQIKHSI
jgi:hypothetical protein